MAQKAVSDALSLGDSESDKMATSAKSDDNNGDSSSKKPRLCMKDLDNRMTVMENSMNASLAQILQTLDKLKPSQLAGSGNTQPRTVESHEDSYPLGKSRPSNYRDSHPQGRGRPRISLNNGIDKDIVQEDILSLHPNGVEVNDFFGCGDSEEKSRESETHSEVSQLSSHCERDRFKQYTNPETSKNIDMLFGGNSDTELVTSDIGLKLAESQVKVLNKSWRTEKPDRLTAFREEYRNCFPIHEQSADMLQVPGLDSMLEAMLEKRHKHFRPWGKSKQLHTQPLKYIEGMGYQGQLAARMNIIAVAYLQQGLGKLLNTLQEKDVNVDRAVQNVRDLFDISNKALDQAGRAGAFHHMIRRKCASEDCHMYSMKDVHTKAAYLPLSGDGVFGKGLKNILADRKELKDQLEDWMPEFFADKKTSIGKRKSKGQHDEKRPAKKFKTDYNESKKQDRISKPEIAKSTFGQKSYGPNKPSFPNQDKSKSAPQRFRIPKKQ